MASLVSVPVLSELFPDPRSGHCMAVVDHRLYVWGGHTQILESADETFPVDETLPNTDEHFIDVYDILFSAWQQYSTTGDIPDLGNGSTFTPFEHHIYLFGGWNEGDFSSDIYAFDIFTNTWELVTLSDVVVKPSPRYLTSAVLYGNKICIFGGVGPPIPSPQDGAAYIGFRQHAFDYGFGWNNEMYFYDINARKWTVPRVVGERPPPCGGTTFNMIDSHQALLFGGRQQSGRVSNVYIFDFQKLQWSTPFTQSLPEEPWPSGRTYHTACCLFDPDPVEIEGLERRHGQEVLVLWGKGNDNKHCQDTWILDVERMQWRQLVLELRPRMWHMACSYHISESRTDIILFGGNQRRRSNAERHVLTELTFVAFGVLSLKHICLEYIQKHNSFAHTAPDVLPIGVRILIRDYIRKFGTQ